MIVHLSRLAVNLNAQGFLWTSSRGVNNATNFRRTIIQDSANYDCRAARAKVRDLTGNYAYTIARSLQRKDLGPETSTQYL